MWISLWIFVIKHTDLKSYTIAFSEFSRPFDLCVQYFTNLFLLRISDVANGKYSFRVNSLFNFFKKNKIIHWIEKIRYYWIEKYFLCLRNKNNLLTSEVSHRVITLILQRLTPASWYIPFFLNSSLYQNQTLSFILAKTIIFHSKQVVVGHTEISILCLREKRNYFQINMFY